MTGTLLDAITSLHQYCYADYALRDFTLRFKYPMDAELVVFSESIYNHGVFNEAFTFISELCVK